MIRRGLENKAKQSQASLKRLNVINSHSENVGLSHYDKTAPDYRSGYLYEISQEEGSAFSSHDEDLPAEVIAKRQTVEQQDKALKEKVTQDKLSKATKTRYTLGRTMKVLPNDKRFVQDLLSDERYKHLHPINYEDFFPGLILIRLNNTICQLLPLSFSSKAV